MITSKSLCSSRPMEIMVDTNATHPRNDHIPRLWNWTSRAVTNKRRVKPGMSPRDLSMKQYLHAFVQRIDIQSWALGKCSVLETEMGIASQPLTSPGLPYSLYHIHSPLHICTYRLRYPGTLYPNFACPRAREPMLPLFVPY